MSDVRGEFRSTMRELRSQAVRAQNDHSTFGATAKLARQHAQSACEHTILPKCLTLLPPARRSGRGSQQTQ